MKFLQCLFPQVFVHPHLVRIACLVVCCSLVFIISFTKNRVDAARAHGLQTDTNLSTESGLKTLASLVSVSTGPDNQALNHLVSRRLTEMSCALRLKWHS